MIEIADSVIFQGAFAVAVPLLYVAPNLRVFANPSAREFLGPSAPSESDARDAQQGAAKPGSAGLSPIAESAVLTGLGVTVAELLDARVTTGPTTRLAHSCYVAERLRLPDGATLIALGRPNNDARGVGAAAVAASRDSRVETLSALAPFLSGIAHRLRNDLTVVVNAAYAIDVMCRPDRAAIDPSMRIPMTQAEVSLRSVFRSVQALVGCISRTATQAGANEVSHVLETLRELVQHTLSQRKVELVIDAQSSSFAVAEPQALLSVLLALVWHCGEQLEAGDRVTLQAQTTENRHWIVRCSCATKRLFRGDLAVDASTAKTDSSLEVIGLRARQFGWRLDARATQSAATHSIGLGAVPPSEASTSGFVVELAGVADIRSPLQ
ncbi:MAG: hypothetical protein ACKVX7_15335 [Planctomycetota bacterium]